VLQSYDVPVCVCGAVWGWGGGSGGGKLQSSGKGVITSVNCMVR